MPTLKLVPDLSLLAWPTEGTIGILDLEYTAWEGSAFRQWSEPWEWREIVQIGMVICDAGSNFSVRQEAEMLVRPIKNPLLSEYFINLTGITQNRVDETAISFEDAVNVLSQYENFVDMFIFNGCDGHVLRENGYIHSTEIPIDSTKMYDFRPLLAKTINRTESELISSELANLSGVTFNGHKHSALDDCRSIVLALSEWRKNGIL